MNQTSDNDFLRRTIRTFDRLLERKLLAQLSLDALRTVLSEMTRFHRQVRFMPVGNPSPDSLDERSFLVAAGCRLSSDLNEAVIDRLLTTVEQHDAQITELSRLLAERLQARNEATRLLKEARDLRLQTAETGEQAGLGMIL